MSRSQVAMTSTATRSMTPAEARDLWGGPEPSGDRPGPAHALRVARDTFLAGERVEMRQLAHEIEVGRSTLYRWFGDRDRLLGEVLWGFCDGLFREAAAEAERRGLEGALRVAHASDHLGVRISGFEPLQVFLANEPEASLRILTTKSGLVQERCIEWFAKEIRREQEAGRLRTDIEPDDLAYAVVRIGEAFLYADQLTGAAVDRTAASRVIRAVLGA